MPVPFDKLLDLTADEILGIKTDDPESLFQPDLKTITTYFRTLSKKWFPRLDGDPLSKDPKATAVERHLIELRNSAQTKLANKTWQEAGYFTCRLNDGKTFRVRSDASHKFELGTMHISPTTVTYVVNRDYADLFANAISVFGSLTFSDDKIKKTYEPCLPTTFKTYEAPDALILTVRKDKEQILLRDLHPFMAKKDLDRHVAWVMSRLHEMARYLDHIGVTHNAITLDNVFVSPRDHTVGLLGGWWYATPFNKTLKAIPAEADEFLSDEVLTTYHSDPKIDLEMIRAAGRELLGDRGGTRLSRLNPAPQPMIDYLRLPSSGKAQEDLNHWYQNVLSKSFGARRFTELPVTYSDVYQPKGV